MTGRSLATAIALWLVTRGVWADPEAVGTLPEPPVWNMPTDEEIAQQAAAISRQATRCTRTPGPSCAQVLAQLRGALAVDLVDRGEPEAAEALLDAVIAARPTEADGSDAWLALVESLAGQVHAFGAWALERQLRLAALDGLRAAEGTPEHIDALLRLAQVERDLDLPVETGEHSRRALALLEIAGAGEGAAAATAHMQLGRTAHVEGDSTLARDHLETAVRLRLVHFGADSLEVAEARVVLGKYIGMQRDRLGAERELAEALRILEAAGTASELRIVTHLEWAQVVKDLNDHPSAFSQLTQAHALLVQLKSRDRALWADLFMKLAGLPATYDSGEDALDRRRWVVSQLAAAGMHDTRGYALACHNLGMKLAGQGSGAEAVEYSQRGVDVTMRQFGELFWGTGTMLSGLAISLEVAGRHADAQDAALRALRIHGDFVGSDAQARSDRAVRASLGRNKWTLYYALSLVDDPAHIPMLWTSAIRWKDSSRDSAARRHIAALGLDAPRDVARALLDLQIELTGLVNAPRDDADATRRRIEELLIEQDRLERTLARDNPEAAATFQPMTWAQLCDALPRDAAILQYVQYKSIDARVGQPAGPGAYVFDAFVLAGGRCDAPARIHLGPVKEIDEALDTWLASLDRAHAGTGLATQARREGEQLRALIWDPVTEALARSPNIYIVPDGQLARVPFAALPLRDGRALVDVGGIANLDSARDLVEGTQPSSTGGNGALLVGDLAYRPSAEDVHEGENRDADAVASPCLPDLTSLPATRRELQSVARRLERADVPVRRLDGLTATESTLNQAAPQALLLHFATHGFAREPGCAQGDQDTPGALAGLAVSKTVDLQGHDDGLWTADEIANLDLRRVQLVVLSACVSGLGRIYDMGGVFGLRRAFSVAGAREILSTVGAVGDQDAAAFMDRFYAHYTPGRSAPDALLAAQRDIVAAQRRADRWDPTAWAYFVILGRFGE